MLFQQNVDWKNGTLIMMKQDRMLLSTLLPDDLIYIDIESKNNYLKMQTENQMQPLTLKMTSTSWIQYALWYFCFRVKEIPLSMRRKSCLSWKKISKEENISGITSRRHSYAFLPYLNNNLFRLIPFEKKGSLPPYSYFI